MNSADHKKQPSLDYLARQIDIWNKTAVRKKMLTTTWRKRTFILILLGTFLGLVGQEIPKYIVTPQGEESPIQIGLAIGSALAIAIASYAGTQILTSNLEKSQIKARATAESLTVQGYLYLMDAPPYGHANAEQLLYERVEFILQEVNEIIPFLGSQVERRSFGSMVLQISTFGLYKAKSKPHWVLSFDADMSFEKYFEERVNGQINGYYLKKAANFQKVVNRANSVSVVTGFLGILIGTIAATDDPQASVWIAFLSTVSASITSYIHANKYEYLMISYISTANQLELIMAKHQSIGEANEGLQRRLVAETEAIFAMEHNAWISEIAGTKEDEPSTVENPEASEETELLNEQAGVEADDIIDQSVPLFEDEPVDNQEPEDLNANDSGLQEPVTKSGVEEPAQRKKEGPLRRAGIFKS